MSKNASKLETGTMIGELEILSYAGMKSRRQRYLCECPCGEQFIAYKEHLLSGRTKRCPSCARTKNITGYTHEMWTAIRRVGRTGDGNAIWQCRCQVCNRVASFKLSSIMKGQIPLCTHSIDMLQDSDNEDKSDLFRYMLNP